MGRIPKLSPRPSKSVPTAKLLPMVKVHGIRSGERRPHVAVRRSVVETIRQVFVVKKGDFSLGFLMGFNWTYPLVLKHGMLEKDHAWAMEKRKSALEMIGLLHMGMCKP